VATNLFFCDGKILFFAIKITWWSQSGIFSIESFSLLQLKPFSGHHFFFLGWKICFICDRDHLVVTKIKIKRRHFGCAKKKKLLRRKGIF
jgi:hypothetical protein